MRRLLTLREVREEVGRSKSAIYQDIKLNRFPAPVKIGSRSAWLREELDAYVNELIANRDAGRAEDENCPFSGKDEASKSAR